MNLKVHTHKFEVFQIIKGILLMLPLLFVLVTSMYVTFNQNAKESYYGETINQDTEIYANNDYVVGKRYYLNVGNVAYTTFQNEVVFSVTDVTSSFGDMPTCNTIRIRSQQSSGGTYSTYCLFFNGSTYINDRNFATTNVSSISFVYVSDNGVDLLSQYDLIFYYEYNKYSFLDNALPYAMSEFNDLGFGKIDFVSLIGDFFIDSAQFNNVYLKFVNTYVNYFLFVELVLFIPSVLHYVIHWFENLGKDFGLGKEKD